MLKFVRGLPPSEQNWHLRVQAVAHEKRGLDSVSFQCQKQIVQIIEAAAKKGQKMRSVLR
jgi:hypothetical protein